MSSGTSLVGAQAAADAQRIFLAGLQAEDHDVDARALQRTGQRAAARDRDAVRVLF
jgi:hypothetical protein